MIVFGHFDSLGPSHMAGNMSADSIEEVWWFAWTAFAVPHGHDVFLAQWQNYPEGQNFGVNGSMLALGVLFMPITKVFGPIVSWNIALRFALAISASSMCFVLRRWVTWWPAAFFGGLLYGFSAYILANAGNYLFLIFVPLPPVFFLLLHEILVRQKWRPSRVGALLGVVCFLQFFIWSEVLVGMVFVGVIATGLFLLVNRHRLQEIWRYGVRAFVFGGVVGGVLLLPPGAFTLFGPQNTHGSPTQGLVNDAFPPDLLGSIVPQFQWLSSKGLTAMATTHFGWDSAEYLGIPMIVVLACFAIFLRKPKTMLFTGAMALITFSLSLGSPLWIDGHKTPVPLPWAVFTHLPLVGGFTPVRFFLFTGLFVAAMFAMGLDEVRRRLTATDRPRDLVTESEGLCSIERLHCRRCSRHLAAGAGRCRGDHADEHPFLLHVGRSGHYSRRRGCSQLSIPGLRGYEHLLPNAEENDARASGLGHAIQVARRLRVVSVHNRICCCDQPSASESQFGSTNTRRRVLE